nr:sodium channel subunit beta-2 isoform X1 [Misgurnus anguillicaudatus]
MPVLLQSGKTQWVSALKLSSVAMVIFLAFPANSMDVLVPQQINALNGTKIKIPCTFTSCYKLDPSKFAMNWTYQETINSTEEMFMTYKNKIAPLKSNRFGDRVLFTGNLDKNDLSITISDVQLTDEGIYHCYVRNPPDRILGHGTIQFLVFTELPPPRDSTIAVAIGASVGGILALLILSMVVVKCIRRHKNQELISDEQKIEEEGKVDGEGGTEEATKLSIQQESLPEMHNSPA